LLLTFLISETNIHIINKSADDKVHIYYNIPKRDEGTGGWRKLHNEELHKLHSSPSIIRIIKSSRMRWGAI
jgi:hypothetical protein